MKKRYESYGKLLLVFTLFLIVLGGTCILFTYKKLVLYEVFKGVVFNDDVLVLVLNDKELKLFQKNSVLFIDNEKLKFKLKKVQKNMLERDGEKYSQVFVEVDISNMYKLNDVVDVSIMKENVMIYEMFKIIWEVEQNKEN